MEYIKENQLPKILFIGAVTVEETTGSSLFFYRLFKNYPPEKLVVMGGEKYENPIFPKARIPQVKYHISGDQIQHPNELFAYFLTAIEIAESFKPDLILSITMGFQWEIAFRVAKNFKIPLDLVLHDMLETHVDFNFHPNFNAEFEQVFKFARNRFCISPMMEKVYHQRFGIASEVLFPLGKELGKDVRTPRKANKKPIKVVYFGNIWRGAPTASTLITLAHLLDKKGIELIVFSNESIAFFQEQGLKTNNLIANPFFKKNEDLFMWFRENASILCLPMSFGAKFKGIVQHSFPSKITDYTSLGLPVLVHAPAWASITKFVETNHTYHFAELVTDESEAALENAIDALLDTDYRQQLGENSWQIWQRFFNPEVVQQNWYTKICIS